MHGSPRLPLEHHQLVAERDVFKREIPSTLQRRNDAPRHDTYPIPHRRLPSLNREKASNLAADGVFATHRSPGAGWRGRLARWLPRR